MNKIKKLFIPLQNLFSLLLGLAYGRSKKRVLFGAWGGYKFADNSRYLFLYLFENKQALNLKNVIWATRNKELYLNLKQNGFECCLIGTKESKKWHLKCGIHIICNMSFKFGDFESDIDNRYSCGAKKIQLWHGVGIKAIGKASNKNRSTRKSIIKKILGNAFFGSLFSLGVWRNEYFLCTSELNKNINFMTNTCRKKRMFISSYPRNCICLYTTDREKQVISTFQKYKGVILYLPTFRDSLSFSCHPLNDSKFLSFLKSNNYLFIEKPHSASKYLFDFNDANVMFLESSFDINVLYRFCTCVISDYSSAAFDSIHRKIPTIIYTPDLEYFKNDDVGLIMDIKEVFKHLICDNVLKILYMLNKIVSKSYFDDETLGLYRNLDEQFYNGIQKDYSQIWRDILKAID